MLGMIFFIVCALAAVICMVFGVYKNIELVKNPSEQVNLHGFFKHEILIGVGFTVAFTAMLYFVYPWAKIDPKVYESLQAIIGGAFFAANLYVFVILFITHYYRKNLPEKLNKWLFKIMLMAAGVAFVAFFILTNGYADYINKNQPLVNSISLSKGFTRPTEDGAFIAFYALCILGGALFVYALANHKMYQEYGEKNILESTFLIAFPAGIIGARVGYVVGNFYKDYGGRFSWDMFNPRTGGLTIVSGAVTGIVVGILWLLWRKRQYNVWLIVDIAVPMILIAQAIGRWGNFFNCEVHGFESDEKYWSWLPKIIYNNIHFTTKEGIVETASAGKVFVPLFLIEGVVNLFGFGLLAHVFGIKLRKYCELGDIGCGYIIWYGLTRVFLEPLRDPAYNMSEDGYWSWIWSMVYVVVGCLLILLNHVIRYYIRKKKKTPVTYNNKRSTIFAAIYLTFAVVLVILGIVLMSSGVDPKSISYCEYNIGLITLIIGISFAVMSAVPIFNIVCSKKVNQEVVNG